MEVSNKLLASGNRNKKLGDAMQNLLGILNGQEIEQHVSVTTDEVTRVD